MALVSLPSGLAWPGFGQGIAGHRYPTTLGEFAALSGASNIRAMMGQVVWPSKTGTKTISSSGGAIMLRVGNLTWANGSTSLTIGLQDMDSPAAFPPRPDMSFDVSTTLTGGSGVTANAWNMFSMGSGSKTLSYGDPIAVVAHMTARGGSDSFTIMTQAGDSNGCSLCASSANNGSSWTIVSRTPVGIIRFNDSSYGWINASPTNIITTDLTESFSSSSSPNQIGIKFRVPFLCAVDALFVAAVPATTSTDFTLALYQGATSPTLLQTGVRSNDRLNTGSIVIPIPETTLSPGVDYIVAMQPSASNNTIQNIDLSVPSLLSGIEYIGRATRTSSGDFTITPNSAQTPAAGVMISAFDDGNSGGGGGSGGAHILGGTIVR